MKIIFLLCGFFAVMLETANGSDSLQKEAQEWVNYLAENNKFQHSPKRDENLYMSVYKPREYCSDAIWWFHNEEKRYNYSNPKYHKGAGHFTQVIWKNSKQIGAAWAIRKDGRLVVAINYHTPGNNAGFYHRNVFPPKAQLLGPEWQYVPPKFARCPLVTMSTHVKGTARKTGASLELFLASVILVALHPRMAQ